MTDEDLVALNVDVRIVIEWDELAADHMVELSARINPEHLLQTRDDVIAGLDLSVVPVDCDWHGMVTVMRVVVVRAFHRRAMGWVMFLHLLIHLLNGDRRRGIRLHRAVWHRRRFRLHSDWQLGIFPPRKEFGLPGKIVHLQSLIKVRETDGRNFFG